jgi:hypothetical protein
MRRNRDIRHCDDPAAAASHRAAGESMQSACTPVHTRYPVVLLTAKKKIGGNGRAPAAWRFQQVVGMGAS